MAGHAVIFIFIENKALHPVQNCEYDIVYADSVGKQYRIISHPEILKTIVFFEC